MTKRSFAIGLFIVALLQTVALATMIVGHERDLANGQEVVLKSEMRDPRDFFRGNYTQLNLAISRLDARLVNIPENVKREDEVFAILREGTDGNWVVKSLLASPSKTEPSLKGRLADIIPASADRGKFLIMDFPFSRYYAPETRALELEGINRRGELGIIVSVLPDGTGKIKGLTIDGKKIYDERLF